MAKPSPTKEQVRAWSDEAMKRAEVERLKQDAALSYSERLENTLNLCKFSSEMYEAGRKAGLHNGK